jgi:ankyrin repeat protein
VAEFTNFAHIAGAIMSDSKSFFEAIRAGDLSKVESLLQADSSLVTARDASGASPVLVATYVGHSEICDLLLARAGQLEIHDAAAAGHLARVKELVAKKPALAKAFSPDGFPVVSLAAVFGHFDVARFLAEKGADISAVATNGTGYNALTGSVTSGHTEMVKWLLETGADPNYRYGPGYTPLLAAAANGRLEIVKLLLAHGADLRATSNDGKSALALATEHNHPAVAEFLKEASTARAG